MLGSRQNSKPHIHHNRNSSASFSKIEILPQSNYFGGTFHKQSQSPSTFMMQTKTND